MRKIIANTQVTLRGSKPTFYPNHRARNPHPGDGLDPLLGPRIFRALRLGPFEGFAASM